MKGFRHPLLFVAALVLGTQTPPVAYGAEQDNLAPYKMLRSLQFVQDSVVRGDHSAGEMQRFMLETIDARLRSADNAIFEDPRNVDAALIYAMSGGNPATLEFLIAKDVEGHFDNRVTDALRKYLSGRGTLVAQGLSQMVPEYRDKKIGPYLALVAGNAVISESPVTALGLYDWARLTATGTIVEEAALRRSIAVSVDAGLAGKGLSYSSQYVRRFLYSPYASQFADLFVQLAVDNFGPITVDDVKAVLAFMDNDRQREVYLRIARRAAISGKNELASLAAEQVRKLSGGSPTGPEKLADLYGGLAKISTPDVGEAMRSIGDIPEETLSPRDRALRQAAKRIAQEVLREPDGESFGQGMGSSIPDTVVTEVEGVSADVVPVRAMAGAGVSGLGTGADPETEAAFQDFVNAGRSKLDEIDDLLNKESTTQ